MTSDPRTLSPAPSIPGQPQAELVVVTAMQVKMQCPECSSPDLRYDIFPSPAGPVVSCQSCKKRYSATFLHDYVQFFRPDFSGLHLNGYATDHIWLMEDGPESHPIGVRLDCGDSGVVYLSRSQAKELCEQLSGTEQPSCSGSPSEQAGSGGADMFSAPPRVSPTSGPLELYPTTWVMNGTTYKTMCNAEGYAVALIPLDGCGLPEGQGEANGKLFKAAPDLVAALQAVLPLAGMAHPESCEEGTAFCNCEVAKTIRVAEAALQKAGVL